MRATSTIPIVMAVSGDPVEAGLIDSLARPGGNITGLSNVSPQLAGKRLERLRETVPGVSSVAVLGPPTHEDWKEIVFAVHQQRVRLQTLQVREPDQFEKAFEAARRERAKALIVLPSPSINYYQEKNCKPCCQEPTTSDVWPKLICHRWWPYVPWAGSPSFISSCHLLRR
jgi:ABC-type uncharacterized transport system substrate-binding protein